MQKKQSIQHPSPLWLLLLSASLSDPYIPYMRAEALRYVIAHYKEKKQEIPTSYIKYAERSYLLQKGSALELLQKEISALESVQREIIQNITRAKYGLSETGENKRKKIFD